MNTLKGREMIKTQLNAEISVYYKIDEGLKVECSEKYIDIIREHLTKNEIFCRQNSIVEIEGTTNIHNFVSFSVYDNNFSNLKNSILDFLRSEQITYVEEMFNDDDEQHLRITLTNVSVFDRRKG
jgi:hypothetical protein